MKKNHHTNWHTHFVQLSVGPTMHQFGLFDQPFQNANVYVNKSSCSLLIIHVFCMFMYIFFIKYKIKDLRKVFHFVFYSSAKKVMSEKLYMLKNISGALINNEYCVCLCTSLCVFARLSSI